MNRDLTGSDERKPVTVSLWRIVCPCLLPGSKVPRHSDSSLFTSSGGSDARSSVASLSKVWVERRVGRSPDWLDWLEGGGGMNSSVLSARSETVGDFRSGSLCLPGGTSVDSMV